MEQLLAFAILIPPAVAVLVVRDRIRAALTRRKNRPDYLYSPEPPPDPKQPEVIHYEAIRIKAD